MLSGPDRQALEACEEWCSDRISREAAAAAGTVGTGASEAYDKRRAMYGMYDVYGRLLRAEAGVSPHLPLHRSLGAFLQGEALSSRDAVCSGMGVHATMARGCGVGAV